MHHLDKVEVEAEAEGEEKGKQSWKTVRYLWKMISRALNISSKFINPTKQTLSSTF